MNPSDIIDDDPTPDAPPQAPTNIYYRMAWYRRGLLVISLLLAIGPMLACEGDSYCSGRNDGSRASVAACN